MKSNLKKSIFNPDDKLAESKPEPKEETQKILRIWFLASSSLVKEECQSADKAVVLQFLLNSLYYALCLKDDFGRSYFY
jgi:hypothetical protein